MRVIVNPVVGYRRHPKADEADSRASRLMVFTVGGNTVVTGDHYSEGQLGFFIPVGAIVPHKLLEEMWLVGKLGGNKRNRVKAREQFGVMSEGLFYGSQGASWNPAWKAGDDVTDELGIILAE
jgi:hypothetical protein